jgi:hypothetical protein
MRLPVRSETDAFRITYGIAFLVGVSLAVGLLFSPVWGGGALHGPHARRPAR